MKKLYPLLCVLFLIYWGCEEKTDDNTPEEVDDTPTEVTLWEVVYSVENTTELFLWDNQLTGSIPPEIGNLTNLTYLSFLFNQLTGEIPERICNLNIDWGQPGSFSISNNQLCSPYPSCLVKENNIENYNYMGIQDTSDCD